jgi:hypothetical protein
MDGGGHRLVIAGRPGHFGAGATQFIDRSSTDSNQQDGGQRWVAGNAPSNAPSNAHSHGHSQHLTSDTQEPCIVGDRQQINVNALDARTND